VIFLPESERTGDMAAWVCQIEIKCSVQIWSPEFAGAAIVVCLQAMSTTIEAM